MLVVAARETVTQHVYVFTIVVIVVGGGVLIPTSHENNGLCLHALWKSLYGIVKIPT